MRVLLSLFAALLGLLPTSAEAAKIVILTDPMTLERRTVVIDEPGRDRFYLCSMPPSTTGCRELSPRTVKRD